MSDSDSFADCDFCTIAVQNVGSVAIVEIQRPPYNYFNQTVIEELASAFERIDRLEEVRAIVLGSQGKAFCAGAEFTGDEALGAGAGAAGALYREALRLFATRKPIVAAIQGAAVGGGLGLCLVADFRVASPEARLSANFVKIGIHPGFGLTHTLPRLIGAQAASMLFYTGRRLNGEEALATGLVDELVATDLLRARAIGLAQEIADNAPLAVQSTRETMREGLLAQVSAQLEREEQEQIRLFGTADYQEGVLAVSERRLGRWIGA